MGPLKKPKTRGKPAARMEHTCGERERERGRGAPLEQGAAPRPTAPGRASPGSGAQQHVDRQTVLLAPPCSSGQSPGRSWPCGVPVVLPSPGTPGTQLGERWPNPAWEVTSSHCLPRRGLGWREPLLSDVMVFVHQPRTSEREKRKATCLTSRNRKERILQGRRSGNEAQHPQYSAQFAIFSSTDGVQKFKRIMTLSTLGHHIIAF